MARQAIFDKEQKVFGYELLYRSGLTNCYDGTDGTEASLSVIRNAFLYLGQRLMEAKRVFINFTRPLLLHGVAETLPPQHTVVEVLEDIQPDDQIVAACQELKNLGYTIALDDYSLANEMQNRLLDLADIIKVDTIGAGKDESCAIARKFAGTSKLLIAEGVESMEDFHLAEAAGFSLFQGYFFSKPVIVPGKDIPSFKLHDMKLLQEVSKGDLDFKALERIIKQDLSLCYTLLKYINSAYFALRDEITSVMQAIILLGETEVRRWAFLTLLTFIAADKPPEVIVHSLVRAYMCESLSTDVKLNGHEPELFLLGIFSMLDVLIGLPFEDILEDTNLAPEIKLALLGKESPYGDLYRTVTSYDRGDWEDFERLAERINLKPERMLEAYVNAIAQADRVAFTGTGAEA